MTCPGCGAERVALIGGLCGHCSAEVSRAVNGAIDGADAMDGRVRSVTVASDDDVHVVDAEGLE